MVAEVVALATIATNMAIEVAAKILVTAHSQTLHGVMSARGLKEELNCLMREFCKIQALLRAAERLCPELRNELILHWLKHVRDVANFADNVLDEISYEELRRKVESKKSQTKRKVSNFFSGSNPLAFRLRITSKVGKVMLMIGEIYKEAQALGLRPVELSIHHTGVAIHQPVLDDLRRYRENVDTSYVVGRNRDELQFVKALCQPSGNQDLSVLAIVGMSGIGKTTLAKRVYENKAVKRHFGERFWLFVSHDFDPIDILREMLESITKRRCDLSGSDVIINMVRECLKERRYLLVLDDVWNTNWQIWESMRSLLKRMGGSTGSKIILTTRNIAVASTMEASLTHKLQVLDEDDSWTLFKHIAFANKAPDKVSTLEGTGRRIVSRCKGIPLAIKTLGHALKSKNNKREWESIESSEVWDLPGDGNRIMPSLLLSFNCLPDPSLKLCFAYCSVIFQKGSLMGREMMIKTWMAQGFLRPPEGSNLTMEDVGVEYLNILLNNCLLQVDKCDWLGRAYYFSMHDLVHDLAVYVSKDTFSTVACISEVSKSSDTEHLYITGKRNESGALCIIPCENTLNKLRTVYSLTVITSEFIEHARFLRVLMLINCGMKEVPVSIGRLKHLRYLSLRRNPIKLLPESVTNLYNLQTLSLLQCAELIELPKSLGNLVNLRHISTSIHVTLPKEIGQLSCLQTLPHLRLQAKGGQIGELGCLENIKGLLSIRGLEYIKCPEDARKAGLDRKAGIEKLELIWSNETVTDIAIMDGLLPHSNLKGLLVENYNGKRFAPWLSSKDFMCSLVKLQLLACESCEELPTLGHLPCLQVVEIEGMRSLDVIGANFFDDDNEVDGGGSTSSLSFFFPSLRTLRLQNLPNLKYWFEPTGKLAFPKLRELKILDCPQLTSAPTRLPSLEHLSIRGTRSGLPLVMILSNTSKLPSLAHLIIDTISELNFLPQGLAECTSLREIKILGCSKLAHLPPSLTDLHSLESIEVSQCCRLTSLPDIKGLSSLREMSIKHCKKLKHTPSGLESCTSLKTLRFTMCPSLKFVPDLSLLSCLGSLDFTLVGEQVLVPRWVTNMSNLHALSIGMFHKRMDNFPDISYLPRTLRRLCLNGWPEVEFLPVELQLFTQLRALDIWHFGGLEALPEWMMALSSLEHLVIRYCKKLKSLLSLAAMQHLAKLRILDIQDCPFLEEQCSKGTGSEWHKIAHIPLVIVNEKEIQKLA